MISIQKLLNAIVILIIASVLVAAFGIQFIGHEEPCPLCYLQRLGMLGVCFGALLNLRFGVNPIHYGVILFSSFFGGFVALRQISLHVCPGFHTFGVPVLGLSLYTWSFLIFVCSILATAILLCLYKKEEEVQPTFFEDFLFGVIFLIAAINAVASTL